MADQRVTVSLDFSANVEQAKNQIKQLQDQLSSLTSTKFDSSGVLESINPASLKEATAQIANLQVALGKAFNQNTGKLDLGLFQQSLQKANMDINSISQTFLKLGPQGSEVFANLAQTIASAEMPMLRLGEGARKFVQTMGNTIRWKIAQTALQTLTGSIQSAVGYAKDLDKSLTNIAIVTNASSEKMAQFAVEANKAAQQLSVTTTGYTDAALIYYQQGLNDAEVKARADVTMKMSNVTGESAQEVSSYMTAIWNNFNDGSQSMEIFADKITALGAATASSSQEIANGLQQFSAIANTVGLSYDYAATALATIVAQTRQSESTVGNALRTIFSRFEGLKINGMDDEGVSLNKYSQALADVGVNILDTNGQLKDMDTILDDLGAKWQSMSKTQQVALAQTVGGVRQYANIIALFDNWDKFQSNLNVAQGAEGTLQQQQEIYERSWEASRKRIKAAAQSIYQDLIDDKFIISLNDAFAGFLKIIQQAIKGLGGLKGVLSTIAAIVTTLFQGQIADKVDNLVLSLNHLYHPDAARQYQDQWINAFTDYMNNLNGGQGDNFGSYSYAGEALKNQINAKRELLELTKNMGPAEKMVAEYIYQQYEGQQQLVIEKTKALQKANEDLGSRSSVRDYSRIFAELLGDEEYTANDGRRYLSEKMDLDRIMSMSGVAKGLDIYTNDLPVEKLEEFRESILRTADALKDDDRLLDDFKEKLRSLSTVTSFDELKEKVKELWAIIDEQIKGAGSDSVIGILGSSDSLEAVSDKLSNGAYKALEKLQRGAGLNEQQMTASFLSMMNPGISEDLQKATQRTAMWGQKVSEFSRNASSMAMQINSIRSAITAFTSSDVEPWQKFVRILTMIGTLSGPRGLGTQLFQGYDKYRTLKNTAAGVTALTPMMADLESQKAALTTPEWWAGRKAALAQKYGAKTMANSAGHLDFSQITEENISGTGLNKKKFTYLQGLDNMSSSERENYYRKLTPEQRNIFDMNSLLSTIGKNKQDKINFVNDIKELERLKASGTATTEEIEDLTKKINEVGKAHGIENAAELGSKGLKNLEGSAFSTKDALLKAFGPMLKFVAIMGAVALAIWALKAAYDAWYAASREGRIEQNAKEIDNLDASIQSLNSNIDNLQQKSDFLNGWVDSLTQAEEKIEGLNTHSTKYRNIVRETNSDLMNTLKQYNLWEKAQISINNKGLYVVDNIEDLNEEIEKQKSAMLDTVDILTLRKNRIEEEQKILTQNGVDLTKIENASRRQTNDIDTGDIDRQAYSQYTDKETIRVTKIIADTLKGKMPDFNGDLSLLGTDEWQSKIFDSVGAYESYKKAITEALTAAGLDSSIVDDLFNKDNSAELFTALANIQDSLSNNFIEDAQMGASAMRMWGFNPDNLSAEQQADFYNNYVAPQYDKYQSLGRDEITKLINKYGGNDNFKNALKDSSVSDILGESFTNGTSTSEWYINGASRLTKTKQMQLMADIIGGDFTGTTLFDANGEKVDYDKEIFEEKINEYIQSVIWGALARTELGDKELTNAYNKYVVEDLEKGGAADKNLAQSAETQVTSIMGLTGDDAATQERLEKLEAEVDAVTTSFEAMNGATETSHEVLQALGWDAELSAEGLTELGQNGEKWLKKISTNGAGAEKALGKLTDSMIKAIGLTDDLSAMGVDINKEFGEFLKDSNNWEKVEKAIKGDTAALKELRDTATKYALEEKVDNASSPINSGITIEDEHGNPVPVEQAKAKIKNDIENIQSIVNQALKDNPGSLTVEIDDGNFYSQLDRVVSATATSIADAQAILASLNLSSADYDLLPEPVTAENPWTADFTLEKDGEVLGTVKGTGSMSQTAVIWHPVPKGAAAAAAKNTKVDSKGVTDMAKRWAIGGNVTSSESSAKDVYTSGYQEITNTDGSTVYMDQALLSNDDFWKNVNAEVATGNYSLHGIDYGQILGAIPPGGGTGSGGSGGSGSGGKERQKKEYEDEIERYHYLLKTIDTVNKKYEELENARSKAYGKDEIEIMDKEIENMEEQIALQKTYLDAISQDYLSDRNAIAAYGAVFDDNGNIINYEEIYRRQIDLVNSAAGDDEAADKAYEQFKKVLEQYEKTNDLLRDTKLSYQELLDKAAELNLEKITVSVDYNVKISNRDREYLEWLNGNLGDKPNKAADKIANLSKQMETYAREVEAYGQGIDAIFESVGVDNALEKIINSELTKEQMEALGLTKQQIEQIEEYKKQLMDTQTSMKDLRESGVETLRDAFDGWNEELDRSVDRLDSLNETLGKYRDIIGMIDQDLIGSTTALNEQLDAAENANNINAIDVAKAAYEAARQELIIATAVGDEETLKNAQDRVDEAHQKLLDSTQDALKTLEDQWKASMERITADYSKSLTGMTDMKYFKDEYDRHKEMSDWYLDDYEKYYNLNKLASQINKDLADDGALAVQDKLNGLLGKINGSLAEGAQISEATVGYYEKELELIEAQMAMEAARNAKSEVRMVRDNEGNMSYVYTANAKEVEDAEANYREKWYNLMDYTQEQQEELQDKMIDSMQDFIDRAVEAAEKFGIGTEAFNNELAKIKEEFSDTFEYLGSEFKNSLDEMDFLEMYQSIVEAMTGDKIASASDFTHDLGDTPLGRMMGLNSVQDWLDVMTENTDAVLSKIYTQGQDYVANQQSILNAAGSSLETLVTDVGQAIEENQGQATEIMEGFNKTLEEMVPSLQDAADEMAIFTATWGGYMDNLVEKISPAVAALNDFQNSISKIDNIASNSGAFGLENLILTGDKNIEDTVAEAAKDVLKDGYVDSFIPIGEAFAELSSVTADTLGATGVTDTQSIIDAALKLVGSIYAAAQPYVNSNIDLQSEPLEQQVQIEANFPNVTNHREIELALNNLILSASQFANKK